MQAVVATAMVPLLWAAVVDAQMGRPHVAVLDGGLQAWQMAGYPAMARNRPFSVQFPARTHGAPGDAQTVAANWPARPDADGCQAASLARGKVEPMILWQGHNLGALNRPFALNLTSGGKVRLPAN
jgi:thiosulfate/3-mercaptopyruvate sulfurtransferase